MLINVNACRIKVSTITVGGIEREPLPSDEPADDLFALLLDLVEEGEDKCVRQPDAVPYEFLSLAAHLSATFLPAHHNYRIKFLLCKLIFGHEESEVLEEFGRLNVPLQLLMTRFAARDGVPFHTTGRDMDDNVEWDILRNWRLGNNMEKLVYASNAVMYANVSFCRYQFATAICLRHIYGQDRAAFTLLMEVLAAMNRYTRPRPEHDARPGEYGDIDICFLEAR